MTTPSTKFKQHFVNLIANERYQKSADWLKKYRRLAFKQFEQQGFPRKLSENWRYVDVKRIFDKPNDYLLANSANCLAKISALNLTPVIKDSYFVVLLNGLLLAEFSKLPDVNSINNIAEPANDQHGLINLNNALWTDGICFNLPNNYQLDKPIEILSIITRPNIDVFYKNLINVGNNSQVTIIENHLDLCSLTKSPHTTTNANLELFIGENSQLDHYKLPVNLDQNKLFLASTVNLSENANYKLYDFDQSANFLRHQLEINLQAKHANCELTGLFIPNKTNQLEHYIKINHLAEYTTSCQNYRGVIADQAVGVFDGKILVTTNGQHTSAKMQNKNLLLSDHATINTKPELKIYTDEVNCSHGATVGQLDQQQIFYLMTRGLSKIAAKQLLLDAFCQDLLNQIADDCIKSYCHNKIFKKINQLAKNHEYIN